MEEQANRTQPDEPGSAASQDEGAPAKPRLRGAFGFLGSPVFWGGLVVGVVALGVGVALGWGASHLRDGDRGRDDARAKEVIGGFGMDDSGEWTPKRQGKGLWQKGEHPRGMPAGRPPFQDGMIPEEIWERVEGLLRQAEEILEKVAEYMESEENLDRFLDRFFESGIFGGDSWSEDGWKGGFGGDYDKEPGIPREGAGGLWEDHDGAGPLSRFGFSFEEFLPGMAFLEECDIAWEDLPEALEGLDGFEEGEDPRDLFEMMDQLLAEICAPASEG